MNIKTVQDITVETVVALRKQAGLSQDEFWRGVCSSQGSGHLFETGKRKGGIPKAIKTLIFLKHVAGIPIDVATKEGAEIAVSNGKAIAAYTDLERARKEADAAAAKAEAARQKVEQLSV